MDAINSYVVSHEQSQLENDALREWELALALGGSSEKCCHSVNIFNGVPVVPMQLASKESKSLVARLMDGARDRVYALHRMILILYAPSVLARTGGTLTLKLINRDTGETILVASEHPVSQAATFVCRWPRAILANSAGLALLVATEAVDTKRGSLVGVLTPFWEDKVSTKMVYEKELPSLMYPLEEQEPAFYVKDLKRLRAVVASKVLLGGKGSDVEPQLISMIPPPPTSTGAVAAPLRSAQKSIAFGSFEPITVGRQRKGKVASGNLPSKPAVLASGQNQDKSGAPL